MTQQNREECSTIPPISTVHPRNSATTASTSGTSGSGSGMEPMSDVSESAYTAAAAPAGVNQEFNNDGQSDPSQPSSPQPPTRRDLPTFKHQVFDEGTRINARRVSQANPEFPLVSAELYQADDDGDDSPTVVPPHEDRVIEIAQAQIDNNGITVPPYHDKGGGGYRRLPKSILVMILIAALAIAGASVGGYCAKGRCSSTSAAVIEEDVTGIPTASPVPTASPTTAPTIPPPPTPKPTVDLFRATALVSLVTDVSLELGLEGTTTYTYPITSNNATTTTALEDALTWLVEDNSVYLDLATESDRLIQRYALAALYHRVVITTGSENEVSTQELRDTWLNGDECEWYEVYCREGTHIVETLRLDNDRLRGTIPLDIGLLTSLSFLDLDGNSLRGRLPTTVGLLTNLTRLELQNNDIFGNVPTELAELTGLTHLDLSVNNFIEKLPTGLASLTGLRGLYIDRNRFTGNLPTELVTLTNLREFWIHENDFEGTVPTEYALWTDLNYAFFQNNDLTGVIPFCTAGFVFEASNDDRMIADCGEVTCDCCTHCCPQEFNGIPQSGACA